MSMATEKLPKLSDAQRRVLLWIGHGWRTEPGGGAAVMVNGKRICNLDTMTALRNAGLVLRDEHGCWYATAAGKDLAKRLGSSSDSTTSTVAR